MRRPLSLTAILLGCLLFPGFVRADSLEEILQRRDLIDSPHRTHDDVGFPDWVDRDSTYAKIFTDSAVRRLIIDWLGDPPAEFQTIKSDIDRKQEYVFGIRQYSGP